MASGGVVEFDVFTTDPGEPASARPWGLLTNFANVLICIAADPTIRQREIAARAGLTNRAVHRIVAELAAVGYLTKSRDGRRVRYEVNTTVPLRGPFVDRATVGDLVALARTGPGASRRASGRRGQ